MKKYKKHAFFLVPIRADEGYLEMGGTGTLFLATYQGEKLQTPCAATLSGQTKHRIDTLYQSVFLMCGWDSFLIQMQHGKARVLHFWWRVLHFASRVLHFFGE